MTAYRVFWAALAAAVVVLAIRVGPLLWQKWQLVRALLRLSKGLDAGFTKIEKGLAATAAASDKTSDELVALVSGGDSFARDAAAHELAERGVDSDAHVEQLVALLDHRDRGIGVAAARALAGSGERARPHLVVIGSLLDGADDEQTKSVLLTLEAIGGAPDAVLGVVARILATSKDTDVRTDAVKVLGSSRRDTALVRTALIEALGRDTYASVRAFAAIGLGWLPADERTTHALEKAREDEDSWVHGEAAQSLARQQNLGKARPETAEQTASTTAYEHGQAVACSLGIGRFVGLTEGQDRDGFTVRRLLVALTTGKTVQLPLACVGLYAVMSRGDAEQIHARFFDDPAEAVASSAIESERLRQFAGRIEAVTGDAWEEGDVWALRGELAEIAFVLEREESELQERLAERYPSLRQRMDYSPAQR